MVREKFEKTILEENTTSIHSITGLMSTTCWLMSTHLSPEATILCTHISHWSCQRIWNIAFKLTSFYTQELNKTHMEA